MLKPIVNPKLSLRARSLFYYFVEKGRVISADELRSTKDFSEGRDALQSAINELKDLKYVKSVRVQNNGQWIARLKFTEEAKKLFSTDNGFSGHLCKPYRIPCHRANTSRNLPTPRTRFAKQGGLTLV